MDNRPSYSIRVIDLEDDFMNFVCCSQSDDYKKSLKKWLQPINIPMDSTSNLTNNEQFLAMIKKHIKFSELSVEFKIPQMFLTLPILNFVKAEKQKQRNTLIQNYRQFQFSMQSIGPIETQQKKRVESKDISCFDKIINTQLEIQFIQKIIRHLQNSQKSNQKCYDLDKEQQDSNDQWPFKKRKTLNKTHKIQKNSKKQSKLKNIFNEKFFAPKLNKYLIQTPKHHNVKEKKYHKKFQNNLLVIENNDQEKKNHEVNADDQIVPRVANFQKKMMQNQHNPQQIDQQRNASKAKIENIVEMKFFNSDRPKDSPEENPFKSVQSRRQLYQMIKSQNFLVLDSVKQQNEQSQQSIHQHKVQLPLVKYFKVKGCIKDSQLSLIQKYNNEQYNCQPCEDGYFWVRHESFKFFYPVMIDNFQTLVKKKYHIKNFDHCTNQSSYFISIQEQEKMRKQATGIKELTRGFRQKQVFIDPKNPEFKKYKGIKLSKNNKFLYIKQLDLTEQNKKHQKAIKRQIILLTWYISHHPSILKILKVFEGQTLQVVYEETGRKLSDEIYDLSPSEIQFVMFKVLSGLKFLHRNGIVHCNIRPDTIHLYFQQCQRGLVRKLIDVKIVSFLKFDFVDDIKKTQVKNLKYSAKYAWYKPLEVLLKEKQKFGQKIDIWAVGCLFAQMLMRKPLFDCTSESQVTFAIVQFCAKLPNIAQLKYIQMNKNSISMDKDEFEASEIRKIEQYEIKLLSGNFFKIGFIQLNLLSNLMQQNPKQRFSAINALQHPYLERYTSLMQLNGQ